MAQTTTKKEDGGSTAATRCARGWMFYDGMMTPKFTFHSSSDVNKLLETQFLELGKYEVADADAESRPDVDWGALFRSENEYSLDMLEDDNITTTLELIERINQKIDSPGKNKEKGMAEAHPETDVQNPTLKQHGDNTRTQKPRQSKIQFSTFTKETTMKSILQQLQNEISPPKSGKSKRISQGFYMRKEIPKSQQIIEYKDECILN